MSAIAATPAINETSDQNNNLATCLSHIKQQEELYGVTVLWAIESGSRAWGFASLDSDYDIRGIFVANKDAENKKPLRPGAAIQGFSDDRLYDWEMWPLDKAIDRLFEGNPIIVEWLLSVEVYQKHDTAINKLRELLDMLEPTPGLVYHYRSITSSHWKNHIEGHKIVNIKKYIYCVRSTIMTLWLLHRAASIESREALPVLLIDVTKALDELERAGTVPESITNLVRDLIERKKKLTERSGECERLEEIDGWIRETVGKAERFLDSIKSKKEEEKTTTSAELEVSNRMESCHLTAPDVEEEKDEGREHKDVARAIQACSRRVFSQTNATSRADVSPKQRVLLAKLANHLLDLVSLVIEKKTVVTSALTTEEEYSAISRNLVDAFVERENEEERQPQSTLDELVTALVSVGRCMHSADGKLYKEVNWPRATSLIREWSQRVQLHLQPTLDETLHTETTRKAAAKVNAPGSVDREALQRTFDEYKSAIARSVARAE